MKQYSVFEYKDIKYFQYFKKYEYIYEIICISACANDYKLFFFVI